MKYTKEYFIEKFEKIPSKEIGTVFLENHCALWYCGVRNRSGRYSHTKESKSLISLFGGNYNGSYFDFTAVTNVNDGHGSSERLGKKAKTRIINKLKSL